MPKKKGAPKRSPKKAAEPVCAIQVTEGDLKVHPVLRHYFGYCLYKVAMRYKAAMDEALSAHGITTTQLGMLRILCDMGSMSQNDLGSGMGIDKASMAKWIEQLDRKGYVDRTENPKDRRIKTVSVTKSGKNLVEEYVSIRTKVENSFLGRLTSEEQAVVRAAIPKLLA